LMVIEQPATNINRSDNRGQTSAIPAREMNGKEAGDVQLGVELDISIPT